VNFSAANPFAARLKKQALEDHFRMATSAGIDVGADAIKAIVLAGGPKSPIEILSAGTLPLGELGRMAEGEDKTLALGMKLKELIRSARIKAGRRRMAVSGQGASIRYLQVPPVPPWRLDMLVAYEVQERGGDKDETNTFDYHILDVPEVNGQNTVMIGILKETAATDFLTLARTAGAGEVEIDHEALALYAAYYHGHGFDADRTVLVCDIGADNTTILLCKNGMLFFARTALGGGRRFTQVLADELKIEAEEAEDVKKTQGEINFDVAPPTGAAKSTLGRRVPGATNVLPRPGMTNILQRPGGPGASGVSPMAGRADASAVRPAPLRSAVQPGVQGGAGEKPATPATPSAPAKPEPTDTSGLKLSSPGSLDLDLSILPLDEQTLPPSTPAIRPAPAPVKPVAPIVPPAASTPAPSIAAPASLSSSDDLSLDLDLAPVVEAPKPAPATAKVDLTLDLPAPSLIPPSPVPAKNEPAAMSLDIDAPANPSQSPPTTIQPAPDLSAAPAAAPESPEQRKRQISATLLREAASICAALENTIQASKAQMKLRDLKIDRVYLTGGGSQLKGLSEFVGRRLRVETAPLEPFKQIAMTRLPAEQATALRAEQHTLAVAVGAALSNLSLPGTFTFLLWPEALKQRKVFWARGAYLYYTAGMVAAALALFLYTPFRNTEMLKQNFENSEKAVGGAMLEAKSQKTLEDTNEEFFYRNKQVVDNTLSGHFFLNILAELKNNRRISEDVWLTQVSTQLPNVIRAVSGAGEAAATPVPAKPKSAGGMLRDPNAEPDTFQAQRRIYLRGFVRGNEKGEQRILAIKDFYTKLVPHPEDPDHADNLFKDIRPIWFSTSDHKQGAFYLTEFVLEAYTEGTAKREDLSKAADKAKGPAAAPVKGGPQKAPPASQADPRVQLAPVAPQGQQPAQIQPNPNAANPNAVDPNAEKAPPKKKKFITGDGPAPK